MEVNLSYDCHRQRFARRRLCKTKHLAPEERIIVDSWLQKRDSFKSIGTTDISNSGKNRAKGINYAIIGANKKLNKKLGRKISSLI